MRKQYDLGNDIKMTNGALLALGSVMRMDNTKVTKSFLDCMTRHWPLGRKVLYDLFSHKHIWSKAEFSHRPFDQKIHKSEFRLALTLNSINDLPEFMLIEQGWAGGEPDSYYRKETLCQQHMWNSKKRFITNKENSLQFRTVEYIRYWYS
jgi:hypothetical protein